MSRLPHIAIVLLGLLWTSGCDVDPFCIDCPDAGRPGEDAGRRADGDVVRRDVGPGVERDSGGRDADMLECSPDRPETCNDFDDDCDGDVDEDVDVSADPDNCGECGNRCRIPHALSDCRMGVCVIAACDVGFLDIDGDEENGCEYRCLPTGADDSACDLRDNDCDGEVDEDVDTETDPDNCGTCGRNCRFAHVTGPRCEGGVCTFDPDTDCEDGFFDIDGRPATGCEYACTPADPAVETCNSRDDDCDGTIDEGDPGGGAACGSDVGLCSMGVEACIEGSIQCDGEVSPTTERCNGEDDDCDGDVDEGNPESGRLCGSATGTCRLGREACVDGEIICSGGVGPIAEICDTFDNDCDGDIDEDVPDGGPCASGTGECEPGVMRCVGGSMVCADFVGPEFEICDGLDNDCDGEVDETFDLMRDRNNCGGCGIVCSRPDAVTACIAGTCELIACRPGYADPDGDPDTGCEYMCDFSGDERCNGRDDDCDRDIDEDVVPPPTFCQTSGVCAGTVAMCVDGAFVCNYPPARVDIETDCDGMDNDCDGEVDEAFPSVGNECNNGEVGACLRRGDIVCNDTMDGTRCTAVAVGAGTDETCNGIDDDCDGDLDEDVARAWVRISGGGIGSDKWVMAYEASRPDATALDQGVMTHTVCSAPDRMPWTNVTQPEAEAACARLGARLCEEDEWQRACQTSASSPCFWSYQSSCRSYQAMTCNGNDYDFVPGGPDDDDTLPTGALAQCHADWGGSGDIFDMSGNVEEWTVQRSGGVNPIRGGSQNDTRGGLRCDFNFVVAGDTFRLPTVGFRCCATSDPALAGGVPPVAGPPLVDAGAP